MMKLFLMLLLMPNLLLAELLLEITKGSENPYRIAIIPFQGSSSSVNTIVEVFNSDLVRTGDFYVLKEEMLLSMPKTIEEINPSEWKLLNIDFIVLGEVVSEENSGLKATYEIYDVNKKTKIRSSTVFGLSLIHI